MTKKQKRIVGLSSAVALLGSTIAVLATSLAWFDRSRRMEPGWKAKSNGAYFAYGNGAAPDGDEDKSTGPYGISSPRHLYNLAWLQYMGHFNKKDENNQYPTVYFELADDLDMTGWTLPPIGTTRDEFIGNFNGNGHKITNLTISNSKSDYNQTPFTGVNDSDFAADANVVNIIGLFGVVGKYQGSALGTYDSTANKIENVGLDHLTVKSSSTKTLIGLAAGYVNGTLSGVAVNHSDIDLSAAGGQYVSSSMTENLSDYSLIGYAADSKYLDKLQDSTTTYEVPTVSNPYRDQGGAQWGGSIDMKTMYKNLNEKKNDTANRLADLRTNQDIDYSEEERTLPTEEYTPIPSSDHLRSASASGKNTYKGCTHYYYKDFGAKLDGTQVQTASYSFSDDYGYIGLSGRYEFDRYKKHTKQITHEGTKNTITISSGSHYLKGTGSASNKFNPTANAYTTSNNGTISDANSGQATNWLWDQNTKTLAMSDNSIVYYLYNNNGSLVLSTSQSSAWEWDTTNNAFKSGNYFLIFDVLQLQWTLSASTSLNFTSIGSGSNYLSYSVSSGQPTITNSTDQNHSRWYFDSSSYVYTTINGTKYYLCANSHNWTVSLTTDANASYRYQKYNSYIRYQYNSTYDYLSYDSGPYEPGWKESDIETNLDITDHSLLVTTAYQNTSTSWNTSTHTESADHVITTYPTYFPLTWADGETPGTYDTTRPSEKNTGYLLGGEYFDGSGNGGESIGDVRLAGDGSAYTTAMMTGALVSGGAYSASNFFAYTFDSSGALKKIGDPINKKENASGYVSYSALGLKKYYLKLLNTTSGSRPALDSMLSNRTAYGLHFMNADLSMDHIITVPYALINGTEYENYQLPEDSIDFNLKSSGKINLFAHTMYVNGSINWNNSNNCFFSLHRIIRSGSNITGIKQIAKIYKNSQYVEGSDTIPEYVYTYRDSSENENVSDFDTGVYDENGQLIQGTIGQQVFDTYWLTDPEYSKFKIRSCYYFEIPVNKGEFALGSVSGKTKTSRGWGGAYNKNGAYLMYLDIGASKKNNTAIVTMEKSTTTTNTYMFPKGVDFKDLSTITSIDAYSAVQGGESSAIKLTTVNTLSVEYTYTPKVGNNDALLTVGPEDGNGTFAATYKRADTEVKNGAGTNINPMPGSTVIDQMERESTYDLTKAQNAANKMTIVEIHKDGNGNQTSTKTWSEDTTWTEEEIGNIINVELDGEVLFTAVYDAPIGSDGANAVTLETRYDTKTHKCTLNFVSASGGQRINVRFTALNLSQTVTEGSTSQTVDFTIEIQNNGVTTGTAYGNVTTGMLNQDIALIVKVKTP